MRENVLISGQIYTTAVGSDGRDKSHLWTNLVSFHLVFELQPKNMDKGGRMLRIC